MHEKGQNFENQFPITHFRFGFDRVIGFVIHIIRRHLQCTCKSLFILSQGKKLASSLFASIPDVNVQISKVQWQEGKRGVRALLRKRGLGNWRAKDARLRTAAMGYNGSLFKALRWAKLLAP